MMMMMMMSLFIMLKLEPIRVFRSSWTNIQIGSLLDLFTQHPSNKLKTCIFPTYIRVVKLSILERSRFLLELQLTHPMAKLNFHLVTSTVFWLPQLLLGWWILLRFLINRMWTISCSSSLDVRTITPDKRKCLFPNEEALELFENYSFSNCLLECRLAKAATEINCIPWYFPRSNGSQTPSCDPWQTHQFRLEMGRVGQDQCGHCLADCEEVKYMVSSTSNKLE